MNQEDRINTIMVQNCFTFCLRDSADFRAKCISHILDGLELQVEQQSVWFQLLDAFNASNLLAAYGAAQLLVLPSQESLVALSAIPPILGRMNKVNYRLSAKPQHVIIDYAHTPDAVQKVIQTLHAMLPMGSRLITIMGCGGNRDQQKRAMIGKIMSEHSDIAIFTSDNPRDEDPILLARELYMTREL